MKALFLQHFGCSIAQFLVTYIIIENIINTAYIVYTAEKIFFNSNNYWLTYRLQKIRSKKLTLLSDKSPLILLIKIPD